MHLSMRVCHVYVVRGMRLCLTHQKGLEIFMDGVCRERGLSAVTGAKAGKHGDLWKCRHLDLLEQTPPTLGWKSETFWDLFSS